VDAAKDSKDFLVTTFAKAVSEGIESGAQYKIVKEPTPGTLQLEVRLISSRRTLRRRERRETLGSGTLTFEALRADAPTAELLVAYKGNAGGRQGVSGKTRASTSKAT